MATTMLKGNEVQLSGADIKVGSIAPVVTVVAKDLKDVQVGGKNDKSQIVVVVPSLDTAVCASETRKFNEEAAKVENAEVIVVSMDLPFAMGRFCTTEGIENLTVGSDFRAKAFAKSYGVLIASGALAGVACRAVFVINTDGIVTYKEICPEITEEPNYEAAIAALTLTAPVAPAASSCCGGGAC